MSRNEVYGISPQREEHVGLKSWERFHLDPRQRQAAIGVAINRKAQSAECPFV
jgi:hypothetical protein